MPTIGTFIQLLPKGFKTARYRATDATVFAAIEGKGRNFRIGDQTFEWARAICSWCRAGTVSHGSDADAVLFAGSPSAQQKLDLFREDRGNA